jgi:hypothetical protein
MVFASLKIGKKDYGCGKEWASFGSGKKDKEILSL